MKREKATIDSIYEKHIRIRSNSERIRMIRLITEGLSNGVDNTLQPCRNIMELRGLGKKIWKGIEAQKYVDNLRSEWHPQS